MYGIEILEKEHDNIIRFNQVVRKMCILLMQGQDPDIADLYSLVDFGRNYADKQHHGKEEKILFDRMLKEMGPLADKLIRNGMLVEHDLGRLHMKQLEEAITAYKEEASLDAKLDIIMNASGYVDLLNRHIEKENTVVYTFAQKQLKPEVLTDVNEQTEVFEKEAAQQGVQEKYLALLAELERKYGQEIK